MQPIRPTYTWHTHVTTYDAGPDERLRLSSQLKLQQEVGEMHLAEVGIGLRGQLEHGMAFVLTRAESRIRRAPTLGERIAVTTWCREIKGAQFLRCYQFTAEDSGEPLIDSVSAFALVDPVNHHILRPSVFEALGADVHFPQPVDCPDPIKWTPPLFLTEVGTRSISWADTDWNHHLNNTVYADLLCDFLPGSAFGKRFLSFSLEFLKEALPGETLTLSAAETAEPAGTTAYVSGTHSRGTCFHARARWIADLA